MKTIPELEKELSQIFFENGRMEYTIDQYQKQKIANHKRCLEINLEADQIRKSTPPVKTSESKDETKEQAEHEALAKAAMDGQPVVEVEANHVQ